MPRLLRAPGIVALGAGALVYGAAALTANAAGAPAAPPAVILAASPALEKLVVHAEPKPAPEAAFEDAEGGSVSLADFRGRVVLLNLWATWCPPCRKEMPSIDRLAGQVAGEDIAVIALSTDRGGVDKVRPFFDEIGVKHLAIYVDRANRVPREAAVMGLPVTLIIDGNGMEVARLTGDAEWDDPAVVELLRGIAERTAGVKETRLGEGL